jgi:hypothetical protein
MLRSFHAPWEKFQDGVIEVLLLQSSNNKKDRVSGMPQA